MQVDGSRGEAPGAVTRWHAVVDCPDPARRSALLQELLADEVVFRSPAVHTPAEGRRAATAYLEAAMVVLGPSLTYHRELYADGSAVLEFHADLDGVLVHGIDLLGWDADERLVEFTVMVRPVKALNTLIERMAAELLG